MSPAKAVPSRSLAELPLVLTVAGVAEVLGISKTCAQELCVTEQLRSVRVGRFRRVPRPALAAFLGLLDPSESESVGEDEERKVQSLRLAQ